MTRNEQLKLIDSTYYRLERCCESSRNWDTYLEIIRGEEKNHRRLCPSHVQCGLTLGQAVRYRAVKDVFKVLNDPTKAPEVRDYFWICKSCFAGAALALERSEQLTPEFNDAEVSDFLECIDYAALNADPRTQKQAA